MNITKIILGLTLFFSVSTYADDQIRTEEYLHNTGIAYCLSKAESYKEEAGIAIAGYFQIGDHSIEASNHVKRYIDNQLKEDLGGYQNSRLPAYLMRCLEISYPKEYREHVAYVLKYFNE